MTIFKTIRVTKTTDRSDLVGGYRQVADLPHKRDLDFRQALDLFLLKLKEQSDVRRGHLYPNLPLATFTAIKGRAYYKVVVDNTSQRFVVCFVRRSDGAVLKGNRKQVEKPLVSRGNIYSAQHGMEAISQTGHIKYLR